MPNGWVTRACGTPGSVADPSRLREKSVYTGGRSTPIIGQGIRCINEKAASWWDALTGIILSMRRFHRQGRTTIRVVRLIVVSAPLANAHLPRFASSEDTVRWAEYRHTLRRYEEFSDINDAGSGTEDVAKSTSSRVFVGNPGPWDVGEWAGKPLPLVSPLKIAQWRKNPDYVGHEGESLRTYIDRVAAWADGLEPGEYVTVSDQSLGRALLVHALDAPPDAFWHCDIPPEWQMRFHRRRSGDKEMWTLRGLASIDSGASGMLR